MSSTAENVATDEICGTYCSSHSHPIVSLQDLESFDGLLVSERLRGISFNYLLRRNNDGPRLLVCHDMSGGYLADKHIDGCTCDAAAYCLVHWSYLDTFVYFSHHFVTIPPVGWINAAHCNGVRVLGTFITEWDDGAALCEQMFADQVSALKIAEKLTEIALVYGFDGWLFNIENKLSLEAVTNVVHCLRLLSRRLHEALDQPGEGDVHRLVWYDSVIANGELKWQNELNERNMLFFEACDAIFLNYTWTSKNLANTVVNGGIERKSSIYVGVDVFGRNCFAGGGYNTCLALREIEKQGLSTALFAPGWCYEKFGQQKFDSNEHIFWTYLAPHVRCSVLTRLPLNCAFNSGFNSIKNYEDVEKAHLFYFNLCRQDLQPHFLCHLPSHAALPFRTMEQEAEQHGVGLDYIPRLCYCVKADLGGSCVQGVSLRLHPTELREEFQYTYFIDLNQCMLNHCSFTYRTVPKCTAFVSLRLTLAAVDGSQSIPMYFEANNLQLLICDNDSHIYDKFDYHTVSQSTELDPGWLKCDFRVADVPCWRTAIKRCPVLTRIAIVVERSSVDDPSDVYLCEIHLS